MRKFLLFGGVVLMLISMFGATNQLVVSRAWHPILTVSGYTCVDGKWKVSGSVGNSESGWKMHIDSTSPDIGLAGKTVAKSGSMDFTVEVGGSATSVNISVTASWPGSSESPQTRSVTVNFSGSCNQPPPPESHKIVVCHATASSTNPYNKVEVDIDSVQKAQHVGGHKNHEDDAWKSYTYAGVNYPGQGDSSLVDNNCQLPPPPPVDVCPNIPGNQDKVPEGMIKDDAGNCVVPPPDVCPNLEGVQDKIPEGMVLDDQGNCVTPPPPPQDVCPNLDGVQETIPSGMIKDDAGNCVTPPPPVDVCPNIEGNQSSVPDGMTKDANGNCVPIPPPPPDVCPNIPGNQSEIPAGMVKDDAGNCVPQPPPPPVDVCPNIEGNQETIPPGMEKDEAGNCVPIPPPPPGDVCPNIPGNQPKVPDGMVKDKNGNCVPEDPGPELTPTPAPKPVTWGANCNSNKIPAIYIGKPFWFENSSGDVLGKKPMGTVEDAKNGFGKLSINGDNHAFDGWTIHVIVDGQWLFSWTVSDGKCGWAAPQVAGATPQPGIKTGGDPNASDNSGLVLFGLIGFAGLIVLGSTLIVPRRVNR